MEHQKILLLEDDEDLARGISFSLEREGFKVFLASNIHEAIEMFAINDFQMLLLDVMLPDGSGFEFCKEIRKNSKVPVIFLTACDEEINVVMGLDIGADDYITKPFRLKELISRINAVSRRYSRIVQRSSNILQSEAIKLDISGGRIKRNNTEIPLTLTEFRLISALFNHPLKTVEREKILSELWDCNGEFVDDNTLSVNIRRLREKLEVDPSNPELIITVRGIGYRWNKPCEQIYEF